MCLYPSTGISTLSIIEAILKCFKHIFKHACLKVLITQLVNYKLELVRWLLHLINISFWKVASFSLHLSGLKIFSVMLNSLSTGAEEAGIPKIDKAKLAIEGTGALKAK